MDKIKLKNFLTQEVSSILAISLVLVASFWVAWMSVTTGNEIVQNAKKSPTFNVQKRISKDFPVDKADGKDGDTMEKNKN